MLQIQKKESPESRMASGFAGVLSVMFHTQEVTGSSPVVSTKPKSFTPLVAWRVSAISMWKRLCAERGQMLPYIAK